MTAEGPLKRPGQSFEGMVVHPNDAQELSHVIKMAFDYRGDVTIVLHSGQQVTGYVFDCHERIDEPYLRLYVENCEDPKIVSYGEVREISFSGEDTAFGRSWDDWAKKWNKDPSAKK